MAIRDLLWACVLCGVEGAIRTRKRDEVCTSCGARYRRGHGADIVVQRPGRAAENRSAEEWSRLLPEPGREGRALVVLRTAVEDRALYSVGEFLGRIERFGPTELGELTLEGERLSYRPEKGEGGWAWRVEDLTAVQPSSATLQLKARGGPLVSLRFLDSSPRLWEARLQTAVRGCYARLGRGEIVEFQPRIVCR